MSEDIHYQDKFKSSSTRCGKFTTYGDKEYQATNDNSDVTCDDCKPSLTLREVGLGL